MLRARNVVLSALLASAVMTSVAGCGALRDAQDVGSGESRSVAPSPGYAEWSRPDGIGESASPPKEAVEDADATGAADRNADTAASRRLIVRDKTLRLRVGNVDEAVSKTRRLAGRYGGTIEQVRLSTEDGPVYRSIVEDDGTSLEPLDGFVVVRVPVSRFEAFVRAASDFGKVLSESESAEDVTRQHIDLKARLRTLQAEADRLRALFDRARTVSEMLQVEKELSRVQGEIESMQAQVDFLERQAAMATVTLELRGPAPIADPGGEWGFRQAVSDSVRAFMDTVNALVVVFGAVLPVLLLASLAALPVVVSIRRRRRAGRGKAAPSESS